METLGLPNKTKGRDLMKFKISSLAENKNNKRYEIKIFPVASDTNFIYSTTNENEAKLMYLMLDIPNEPDIKVFRQKVIEKLMQPQYRNFAEKTIKDILSKAWFIKEINDLEHSIAELQELYNECSDEFFAKQLEFAELKMSLYQNFRFSTESGFEFPVFLNAISIIIYSVMKYLFDDAVCPFTYKEHEGFEDFEMFLVNDSVYAILDIEL